jgi:hydroxypyruvate isomerase
MDRRQFIATGVGTAAALVSRGVAAQPRADEPTSDAGTRLPQSVCRWCFPKHSLTDLCAMATRCDVQSVELLDPEDIERVRESGLQCAIANGPCTITKGLNRLEQHDAIVRKAETLFPQIAKAGCGLVIVFAGNRDGLDDTTGLWNCNVGLRRLIPIAEANNLQIAMELLNSRVDHKDHMGDRVKWGIELCHTVTSVSFGLLYDIYHMQIMDGDITRTMCDNWKWIKHVHTAGVPGRGPLGPNQELNYRSIIRALHGAGYRRYIGHEFMTQGDAEADLKAAVAECLG